MICPPLASRQSNVTTLPDATLAIGGIAGSQARWKRSRVTWNAGVVAIGDLLGGSVASGHADTPSSHASGPTAAC